MVQWKERKYTLIAINFTICKYKWSSSSFLKHTPPGFLLSLAPTSLYHWLWPGKLFFCMLWVIFLFCHLLEYFLHARLILLMSMLCKSLASQNWCWSYIQVLWPESGWKPVPLVDIIEGNSVKRAYQKALLCLHPDKLQQKGVASYQKYIAEKVFEILQVIYSFVVFVLKTNFFPSFKVGVGLFFTELSRLTIYVCPSYSLDL